MGFTLVDEKEAGDALLYDYTDKLKELIEIFHGQRAQIMILADTHLSALALQQSCRESRTLSSR